MKNNTFISRCWLNCGDLLVNKSIEEDKEQVIEQVRSNEYLNSIFNTDTVDDDGEHLIFGLNEETKDEIRNEVIEALSHHSILPEDNNVSNLDGAINTLGASVIKVSCIDIIPPKFEEIYEYFNEFIETEALEYILVDDRFNELLKESWLEHYQIDLENSNSNDLIFIKTK